jgi:hypothetical protein
MVPVDLRPPERIGELGNEFGLVLLDLAVTEARADRRLALTKARMDALKRSPEPLATKALLNLLGRGPKLLEDFSNDLFGRKASVVMTNVVGPAEELYLAGVPIERIFPWAPHPGKQLGMAVSILSYNGAASLTVIGDARLVPDPELITAEFAREFKVLLKSAAAGSGPSAAKKTPAGRGVAQKPTPKAAAAKASVAKKLPAKKAATKTAATKTAVTKKVATKKVATKKASTKNVAGKAVVRAPAKAAAKAVAKAAPARKTLARKRAGA